MLYHGAVSSGSVHRASKNEACATRGFEGHHLNSVNGSPDLAGNPNNIKFVEGRAGNLAEHGGNFRNATSRELISRVSVATILWSAVVEGITAHNQAMQSGISVGFFTGNFSI